MKASALSRTRIFFVLLAAAAAIVIASTPLPRDDAKQAIDFAAIEHKVLPGDEELAFRSLGWRTVFWDAVKEAQREKRPILLWAMNGHPLGCT